MKNKQIDGVVSDHPIGKYTLVTKTKDKEGSYKKRLNIATSRFDAISQSLTS